MKTKCLSLVIMSKISSQHHGWVYFTSELQCSDKGLKRHIPKPNPVNFGDEANLKPPVQKEPVSAESKSLHWYNHYCSASQKKS